MMRGRETSSGNRCCRRCPCPIIIRWLKTYQIPRPPDTRWYEEKRDDILFGRYLRWHYNDLWKKMREEWTKDPGLPEGMFDYFEIEDCRVD